MGSRSVATRAWTLLAALLATTPQGCTFPNFNIPDSPGGTSANGGSSAGGGADVGGNNVPAGGSAGNPSGGVAGTAGDVAEAGSMPSSGGEGGAAGSPFVPKQCADYDFLPSGCSCSETDAHAYLFCISPTRTWPAAAADCSFYDMQLVRIESPKENAWVLNEAGKIKVPSYFQYFWIGGSSVGHAGDWRWPDGAQFWQGLGDGKPTDGLYSSWRQGCPNDGLQELCAQMDVEGWDDSTCTDTRPYVCESY